MQQPPAVLIVSYKHVMQTLISKICQHAGASTVIIEPVKATDRLVTERELAAFALVVLETDVPWEPQGRRPYMACRLLREWTALVPTLPFVLIGMQVQKHALLMIRADIVRFVAKPFKPNELEDAILAFLPEPSPEQNRSAATMPKLMLSPPASRNPAASTRGNNAPFSRLA